MGFLDKTINSLYNKVVGSASKESEIDNSSDNKTKTINSQCKVVVYNWNTQQLKESGSQSSELCKTNPIDISSRLLSVNFSKSMVSPSGVFSINLANNPGIKTANKQNEDWKDIIKPGTWCAIYFSQEGNLDITSECITPNKTDPRYLRCIGYIERISARAETGENGSLEVVYELSGRDFGIIFEETTIWLNMFHWEKLTFEASKGTNLNVVGNTTLDKVMQTIHDLIFAPKKVKFSLVTKEQSLTELAKQWLLPSQMLKDLKMTYTGESYYGNIDKITQFEETVATIPVTQPIDYLRGNVWENLKALSIPEFHELFCETTEDGKMKLIFRPIPWALNRANYPKIGIKIKQFLYLTPKVQIPKVDIISFDIGEDSHNRKNHFLVTISTALFKATSNIDILLGSKYPRQNKDSVKRHGFRPMHVVVNSMTMNQALTNGETDRPKLIEYNELLYDYWNQAIFFETGTLEKIGSNDVKLGKTLQFEDTVPYIGNKIFYIEEYSDTFVVEPNGAGLWTQVVKLTRGAEEKDLKTNSGFAFRDKKYISSTDYTSNDEDKK